MIKHKMVAIKNICDDDNDPRLPIYYFAVEGEILDVSYDKYSFIIHEDYERNGQIISGIRGEFNDNVFIYFVHLSEYREKQIKTILDD